MPLFCRNSQIAVVLIAVALSTAAARAQGRNQSNDGPPPVELNGKVVGVQRGIIQAVDEDNQEGLIKVDKDTRVYVTGEALPSVLRNGMFVRFTAAFDGATAKEPVKELEIFEPSDQVDVGVFPEDPTDPNTDVLVAGRLTAFKNGKLLVVAGRQRAQAELAEDAEITIKVSDYSLARPGDELRVKGQLFAPGKIIATQVDIMLAEPIGEPEKKPRGKKNPREKDE